MNKEDRRSDEFPFSATKVPVCWSVDDFKRFMEDYPNYKYCPYLADKTEPAWEISTSRVYMNKVEVLPGCIYVPCNIQKDDDEALAKFYDLIKDDERIVAANITQPHKNNPILRKMLTEELGDCPEHFDCLIRNEAGVLVPHDLNAPSFMGWYEEEVGSIEGATVVLVGVGGVGEPLARSFAESNPAELILVDPKDKTSVVEKLKDSAKVTYRRAINEVSDYTAKNHIVVINAAGKEGADDSGLLDWLRANNTAREKVFVDLRPHMEVETVTKASGLGWKAYTGHGMNARNDHTLVGYIAEAMGVKPLPFVEFKNLVADAS